MPDANYETLLVEHHENVARVVMNRPDVRNAQSLRLIDELDDAMRACESDDDVHVVILAGAGKSFSTGHDLKELVGADADPGLAERRSTPEGRLRHEQEYYVERCLAIHDLRKPTIAEVQGHCVAAGLMLACMCDLIVAADDAVFQNPVLRMTGAAVELLVEPWELGARKAKEFLFTGDSIDAHEAWRLGMVNRVVPPQSLTEATMALAERIASMPPVTVQLVKKSINKTFDLMGKRDALDFHFVLHQFAHDTATAQSALAERSRKGSMKEVFAERDRGFES
jgi:enoyl-CoA hydratase